MVCAQCRQGIQGQFLRVGKLAFHPEHFTCRGCHQRIDGTFNVHQGAFFHPKCYTEQHAPRCAQCSQPLTGQFVVHGRKNYHEACYKQHHAPRCAQCSLPLTGKFVVHEGQNYHGECYAKHKAVNCQVCSRGIVGVSLTDYWGYTYHAEHAKEFATCLYCAKLLHPAIAGGGGGLTYPDGRAVCRGCHKTAVHRDADAQRVVTAVRARMQSWGINTEGIDIPVRMIDRTKLAQYLARGPHKNIKRVSGFANMQAERHGRDVRNKQATIFLLTGMPLGWLEATAAHELMHVWNFHHGPGHTFALEEGSCNYMSYRIHQEQTDPLAAYHIDCLMKDPDPGYGVGFRKVKRYVERNGFPKLLTLLQRSKDFPLLDGFF